ncbi:unnamed protein product [Spirodela intermedia]|uniref:chorismate mutase n=1 Tax=Spirodela intermedia TaxID=51605 RepID=A0A7I8IJC8_SPIIN|nr:unnamed protein product [Spirodela intermedia]CAA6657459.1 unnamed protein product [Spirodela intermedia]
MDGFHCSLIEFMLHKTERLHSLVGRYNSPDEHPFFGKICPSPSCHLFNLGHVLHGPSPRFAKKGSDGNCGSSAVCDTICLQALSKRIHYGKFVAEAKFQATPDTYVAAIRTQDRDQIMRLLTYEIVESKVKERIHEEGDCKSPVYKIKAGLVADLYGDWIMPLTKEVQVEYLLRRLD